MTVYIIYEFHEEDPIIHPPYKSLEDAMFKCKQLLDSEFLMDVHTSDIYVFEEELDQVLDKGTIRLKGEAEDYHTVYIMKTKII